MEQQSVETQQTLSETKDTVNEELIHEQLSGVIEKSLDAALTLNHIMDGKSIEDLTDEELLAKIELQSEVVALSEIEEWEEAYGKDLLETVDGVVDCIFTIYPLEVMIREAQKRNLKGVNTQRISMILARGQNVINHLFTGKDGTLQWLIEANDLVIENNMSKVTTNPDEFKTWESPDDEPLIKSNVVVTKGGKKTTYYMLKNEFGKVRKRKGFTNVSLEHIVEML